MLSFLFSVHQIVRILRDEFRSAGLPIYLVPYSVIPSRTGTDNAPGGIIQVTCHKVLDVLVLDVLVLDVVVLDVVVLDVLVLDVLVLDVLVQCTFDRISPVLRWQNFCHDHYNQRKYLSV